MSGTNCTGVSCWLADQVDILTNIANTLIPVQKLISGGAYLMGVAFALKAVYTLKSYGEARSMMSSSTNIKEPLVYFIVAGMLIYLPTAFQVFMNSTFGYSNVLAYAPVNSNSQALNTLFGSGSAAGRPLALIIQTIGLIAFIRGWVLIARSSSQGGQQPGGVGKGFIHVFGGIMAMNIVGTLQIINNTLYGTA